MAPRPLPSMPPPESSSGHLLTGRKVAFTGRLSAMPRREALRRVRESGGVPADRVTRRTDLLVVGMQGWPVLPDGSISHKLQQAEEIQARGGSLTIISESEFLEAVGLRPRSRPSGPRTCSLSRASRLLGLSPQTIRRCRQFGLVRPEGDALDFQDLVSLRRISDLLQEGMTAESIAAALSRLARILPDFEKPLSQVRLIGDSTGALLAELKGARMDARGQMLLDFSGDRRQEPAASVHLDHRRDRSWEAQAWFERGLDCEDEGDAPGAMAAYRRALELSPDFIEAHYNLGNRALHAGDFSLAEAHYRDALERDPEHAAAWYNLGYALAEQERFEETEVVLRHAVRLLPTWPDAHFNLAVCLEELGRPRDAARHWQAYLRLEPDGEWAQMARNHLRAGRHASGLRQMGRDDIR